MRCSVAQPVFSEFPETVLSDEEMKRAAEMTSQVPIAMSQSEVALFIRYISKAANYFESGCGGSTMIACKAGKPDLRVTSIDSSKEWIGIVLNSTHVAEKSAKKLLTMTPIDIGPIGAWGFPKDSSAESKSTWHKYSKAISATGEKYDLVLVDGRFRVACLIEAYLSNPQASILVHDFFDPGHHHAYKVLLEVSEVVDRAHTLVALRRKPNASKEELVKVYDKFVNVPARR